MKWQESYNVKFHDTNANEIVGASQILKFLQETAMCQMRAQKPSYEELFNQNKAFILSNIRIEIYSPIYAFDKIEAYTWACKSRGYTAPRSYMIKKGEELLCEAHSNWALVSVNEKKLLRVNDEDFPNYYIDEPITLINPVRIKIPSEVKMNLVGEYTVRYTDTDMNGHMNNTNYPDMLFNCIPNAGSKMMKSIALSFVSDAKVGDNLKIYMTKIDGKYYLRSLHDDGRINVEAEFIFENLE